MLAPLEVQPIVVGEGMVAEVARVMTAIACSRVHSVASNRRQRAQAVTRLRCYLQHPILQHTHPQQSIFTS